MEVAAVTMGPLSLQIYLATFLVLVLTISWPSVRRMRECPYFDTRRLWSLPLCQNQNIMIILTTIFRGERYWQLLVRKAQPMGPGFPPPPWELYDQRLLNKILFIGLLGPFLLAIKQDTPSLHPRMPCYCPISDDNKIVNINFESDCPRRVFDVNIRIVRLVEWSGDTTCFLAQRSGRIFHLWF